MATSAAPWDTSYEWKAVMLLGLGFGLVGLDRWIIAPLFPFMLGDLGLDIQDRGNTIGILGMAWGVFAIFSGRLSDSIGSLDTFHDAHGALLLRALHGGILRGHDHSDLPNRGWRRGREAPAHVSPDDSPLR